MKKTRDTFTKYEVISLNNYLTSLPKYDPEKDSDYIHQLLSCVKTTKQDLWEVGFPSWLISTVASPFLENPAERRFCSIVLVGGQGFFKTSFLDYLLPPALATFSSLCASFNSPLAAEEIIYPARFGKVISLGFELAEPIHIDAARKIDLNKVYSQVMWYLTGEAFEYNKNQKEQPGNE